MNDDVYVRLPREVAEITAQRKRGAIADACRSALSESSGVRLTGEIFWDVDQEEASGIGGVSVRGLTGFIAEAINEQGGVQIRHPRMGICATEPVDIYITPSTPRSEES